MATAFIPAKGNSKRIPRKNLAQLGGEPLIRWTLEACRRWAAIDRIVVATEDDEIESISSAYGAEIYPLDEADLRDERTVSQLWKAFCAEERGHQVLLHITNPFRRIWELERAWRRYLGAGCDLIMSVREERHLILRDKKPIIPHCERMSRLSHACDPFHVVDGSFYISSADYVTRCGYFEEGNVMLFPVTKISGMEIDYPEDLELCRIVADSCDWWNSPYQDEPNT